MTVKINVSVLTGDQLVALFEHFMALDQARLAGQNFLLASLVNHPDCNDALRDLLNAWSADANAIGEASDAEIQRIVSSTPRKKHH